MKVIYEKQFRISLRNIADFIAKDNASASSKFKKSSKIYRESIYYDNES